MKLLSLSLAVAALSFTACDKDDDDKAPVVQSKDYESLNGRWLYSVDDSYAFLADYDADQSHLPVLPLMIRNASSTGGELIFLGVGGNVCADWTSFTFDQDKVALENAACELNFSVDWSSTRSPELKIGDTRFRPTEDTMYWKNAIASVPVTNTALAAEFSGLTPVLLSPEEETEISLSWQQFLTTKVISFNSDEFKERWGDYETNGETISCFALESTSSKTPLLKMALPTADSRLTSWVLTESVQTGDRSLSVGTADKSELKVYGNYVRIIDVDGELRCDKSLMEGAIAPADLDFLSIVTISDRTE